MKNIVVIGRGAVGAIYAKALSQCPDIKLRVAVDPQRLERYNKEPFSVNGQQIHFDYFTPSIAEQVDLIIIATKWAGYDDALQMAELLAGPQTQILPLLNGLLAYQQAAQRFGATRLLRAYFFGHTASKSSEGVFQDGAYRTVLGEDLNVEGQYSDRLIEILNVFDRAKIRYRVDPNMISSQWQKFVINIGTNQVTALNGGLNYKQLTSNPELMQLSCELMSEAIQIAAKLQIPGHENMMDNALQAFKVMQPEDYSSMAQDVRAKKSTEIDIFAYHIIKLARELDIKTPYHELILQLSSS